jgi:serine/threonine protein kinase
MTVLKRHAHGKVITALDRTDSKLYILKQIHLRDLSRSLLGVSRLEEEINLLRRLSHPNIIHLRESLHVPKSEVGYTVTEFADYGSLARILKMGIHLTSPQIQYIFREIARGVEYLHSLRIVHHDIKAANILLSKPGRVLICDFGGSCSFDTPLVVFGTPLYHAPETFTPEFSREALGITLYEMIYGCTPFSGTDVYEIIGHS